MTDPPNETSPHSGRLLRWVAWTSVALALLLLAGVARIMIRGQQRLDQAIARIEARGESLSLEPSAASSATPAGLDPARWLGTLTRTGDRWSLRDLESPRGIEGLLEASPEELDDESRALLEALRDALHAEAESGEESFTARLDQALDDPANSPPLSDGQRLALRARARSYERLLETALEACSLAVTDRDRILRELADTGPVMSPDRGYEAILLATATLVESALHAAVEERPDAAVDALEAAFCVVAHASTRPWLVGSMVTNACARTTLRGVRRTLPHLPPGVDLSTLESQLERFDPSAITRSGILDERALGHRVFTRLSDGSSPEELGLVRTWLFAVYRNDDEVRMLEAYETVLDNLERPFQDRVKLSLEERPWWAFLSAMLLPNLERVTTDTSTTEAERLLARVALRAQGQSTQAARALAGTLLDPFDSQPLRTKVLENGWLVIWSIGRDGTDATDIVWQVPPR